MKFKTVLKAHAPLALCAAACTMAMLGVLRALGVWGPQVVWGAVLGTGASMANLLLLQMTVQCAEQAAAPAAAEPLIRRAAVLRLLILCAVGYAGLMLPGLFAPAVVLPFFFPRLCALLLRKAAPLWGFARQKFFCQAAQKD